jgi:hypothetical protein
LGICIYFTKVILIPQFIYLFAKYLHLVQNDINMASDKKKKSKIKIKVVEETGSSQDTKSTEEKAPPKKLEHEDSEQKEAHEEEQTTPQKSEETKSEKEDVRPESPDKIPFWVLLIAFLIGISLGAGLIGGVFYYDAKVSKIISKNPTPTLTATIESTQTPAPTGNDENEEIDLSKYSIEVLNGAGIAGEAGKAAGLLEDVGFTETSTGNASSYNYTVTEVSLKPDTPEAVYKEIEDALASYNVVEADPLEDSSDFDAVVIVGSEKSE